MTEDPFIPFRICCGQQHLGALCPDGWVMCCLCFERVKVGDLNLTKDGYKEDVCRKCAEIERAAT